MTSRSIFRAAALSIVAASALAAGSGFAQTQAAEGAPADDSVVQDEKSKEPKVVCYMERQTGSYFKRKVCRKATKVGENDDENARAVENMRLRQQAQQNAQNGATGGI